ETVRDRPKRSETTYLQCELMQRQVSADAVSVDDATSCAPRVQRLNCIGRVDHPPGKTHEDVFWIYEFIHKFDTVRDRPRRATVYESTVRLSMCHTEDEASADTRRQTG